CCDCVCSVMFPPIILGSHGMLSFVSAQAVELLDTVPLPPLYVFPGEEPVYGIVTHLQCFFVEVSRSVVKEISGRRFLVESSWGSECTQEIFTLGLCEPVERHQISCPIPKFGVVTRDGLSGVV